MNTRKTRTTTTTTQYNLNHGCWCCHYYCCCCCRCYYCHWYCNICFACSQYFVIDSHSTFFHVFSWPIICAMHKFEVLGMEKRWNCSNCTLGPRLVAGDGKVTPGALCSLQSKAWFWLVQGGLPGLRQRHRIGRDILTQKVVIRCELAMKKHKVTTYLPTIPRLWQAWIQIPRRSG